MIPDTPDIKPRNGPAIWLYPLLLGLSMLIWLDHFDADGKEKISIALLLLLGGALAGTVFFLLLRRLGPPVKYGVLIGLLLGNLTSHAISREQRNREKQDEAHTRYFYNYIKHQEEKALREARVSKEKADSLMDDIRDQWSAELTDEERQSLQTCEICGYVAILPEDGFCMYCMADVFDSTGVSTSRRAEWRKDQQLGWFAEEEASGESGLYGPPESHGFRKDPRWKPSITRRELRNYIEQSNSYEE